VCAKSEIIFYYCSCNLTLFTCAVGHIRAYSVGWLLLMHFAGLSRVLVDVLLNSQRLSSVASVHFYKVVVLLYTFPGASLVLLIILTEPLLFTIVLQTILDLAMSD